MSANIKSCKYAQHKRTGTFGQDNKGSYQIKWIVIVDGDCSPIEILLKCNAPTPADNVADLVPEYGDVYTFLDDVDFGSFAQKLEAELRDEQDPLTWIVIVDYSPAPAGHTQERLQEPNPLNWPVEVTVRWNEQQIPIEQATSFTSMPQIRRGTGSGSTDPDHIVNACGQQTIDPQMKSVYLPILILKKNFSSYTNAIDLNNTYQSTTNIATFLGGPARCWKYLVSEATDVQQKHVPGVGLVTYYPTTTQIEFKSTTWDLLVLNNGMVCFRKKFVGSDFVYLQVDGTPVGDDGIPGLFECQVNKSATDHTPVPAAEPVNLDLDGTQKGVVFLSDGTISITGDQTATHIDYRYLTPVDYGPLAFV